MSDWNDRDKDKEPQEIVIQDRRHTRDLEAEAEVEQDPEPAPVPQPPPAPEPPAQEPAAAAPGEVVEFQRPERPAEEPAPAEPPPSSQQAPPESPEEAQMRMLFEIGINGYLHGQIQLLLTFALIYLGRQPNPATGLVTADLEKARTSIDLLEFIATRTLADLPAEEQASLRQLVGELKMVFAQSAQAAAAPEPAPE